MNIAEDIEAGESTGDGGFYGCNVGEVVSPGITTGAGSGV